MSDNHETIQVACAVWDTLCMADIGPGSDHTLNSEAWNGDLGIWYELVPAIVDNLERAWAALEALGYDSTGIWFYEEVPVYVHRYVLGTASGDEVDLSDQTVRRFVIDCLQTDVSIAAQQLESSVRR